MAINKFTGGEYDDYDYRLDKTKKGTYIGSWLPGNPVNSDKEILDDYDDVHYFFNTNTFDQTKANNILKKYNYAPSDDESIVKRNMRDFKEKVDNDMGLSWRRIKMFDVSKLNRFLK